MNHRSLVPHLRRTVAAAVLCVAATSAVTSFASVGLDKKCVPAHEKDAPKPNPCQGTTWSAAYPGTCSGGPATPFQCREDGKTNVTIDEVSWTPETPPGTETTICKSSSTGNTDNKEVGQCYDY